MNQEKVSVWAGLCRNGRLIGPFFVDGNLNGERYLQKINEDIVDIVPQLEEHFEQHDNGAFRRLWWIQDGAPAH